MRKPVHTVVLLISLLALDSCGKKPQQAPPPVTTSSATGAASAVVALPNFTALVKKEGPAVVNISTTQKIRREHIPFPAFPGTKQDDPFYEFFRRFAPGEMFPHEFRSQSLGSGFIVEAVEKPKSTQKSTSRSAIISLRDNTKVDVTWHGSNRYTKA